jgi:hypothetical protein
MLILTHSYLLACSHLLTYTLAYSLIHTCLNVHSHAHVHTLMLNAHMYLLTRTCSLSPLTRRRAAGANALQNTARRLHGGAERVHDRERQQVGSVCVCVCGEV